MSQTRRSDREAQILRLRHAGEDAAARLPALQAEARRIAATVAPGVHGRRRSGLGETFWQYRHHQTGDGQSDIDWRRSAKTGQLFVRQNEWEAANTVWIWRDGGPSMDYASSRRVPTKRDRAAVCAIALATLLTQGGERVAALNESGRPRSGAHGLERVSRHLAIGPGDAAAVDAPALARHGRVILAGDFLDPLETWHARFDRFAGFEARGVMLRVIDPAEEDFPYTGRTRFRAPGSHDDILFGRAEDARSVYQKRWTEHGEQLDALARQRGWVMVTHRTDKPASIPVMAIYQALAGGLAT